MMIDPYLKEDTPTVANSSLLEAKRVVTSRSYFVNFFNFYQS